jgi:hypothetical protein
MSGGNFHALSDDQLKRLLAGELAHEAFLGAGGAERPRETYAQAAQVWYELSQVLQAEGACGAEQTDRIPEMVGFSYSPQVQATAGKLAALGEAEVRKRCEGALMDATPEQVLGAVNDLKGFYQRAAERGEAVLFRVS